MVSDTRNQLPVGPLLQLRENKTGGLYNLQDYARGVKLEVIYMNQTYSPLGTHSPAAIRLHRLDKIDIDRN